MDYSTDKNKINIVGFSGKIGVGKNYLSETIIGKKLFELGYHVHFVGFGDFVKYEVGSRLNKTAEINEHFIQHMNQTFSGLFVNKKKEIRRTLQLYGTEITRQGGDIVLDQQKSIVLYNEPNIWIKSVYLHILNILSKSYAPEKDIFLITDVRFINEVQFIKSLGGIVVRVNADDRNQIKLDQEAQKSGIIFGSDEYNDFIFKSKTHSSETSLDSCDLFDIIIPNEITNQNVNQDIQNCIQQILNNVQS